MNEVDILDAQAQAARAQLAAVSSSFSGFASISYVTGAIATALTPYAMTSYVDAGLALKANLASPTFTGTVVVPTAAPGTNNTQAATTAFVVTALSGYATTGSLAAYALLASPTFTGTPAAPTAAPGTNTTQLATTAFVTAAVTGFAPLASPAFTGTPTAPTATAGTNTTQLATTAFVTTADNLKANLASPTFTGTPTLPAGTVFAKEADPNEGGQFRLEKSSGATGIAGTGVVFDMYLNTIRIFDNGGTNKGVTLDISSCVAGAAGKLWHDGNDGSGSGLDADLLDGQHGSYYATAANPIITGTLAVNNAAGGAFFNMVSAAGTYRQYAIYSGSNARWAFGANNVAESGSNAGSNFYFDAYSDGGAFLGTAFSINRATFSMALGGTPTAPTATAGTNTTQIATTAFVTGALTGYAPLASPTLTGTPAAPTAAPGTNTTQVATTAFVAAAVAAGTSVNSLVYNFASSILISPAASTTYYSGSLVGALGTAAGTRKIVFRKAGTIKYAEVFSALGSAPSTEAWSVYIRLNNTTDTLIQSLSSAATERSWSNSGLSIAVSAGDYIEIKIVTPAWATAPSTMQVGGYVIVE